MASALLTQVSRVLRHIKHDPEFDPGDTAHGDYRCRFGRDCHAYAKPDAAFGELECQRILRNHVFECKPGLLVPSDIGNIRDPVAKTD